MRKLRESLDSSEEIEQFLKSLNLKFKDLGYNDSDGVVIK